MIELTLLFLIFFFLFAFILLFFFVGACVAVIGLILGVPLPVNDVAPPAVAPLSVEADSAPAPVVARVAPVAVEEVPEVEAVPEVEVAPVAPEVVPGGSLGTIDRPSDEVKARYARLLEERRNGRRMYRIPSSRR